MIWLLALSACGQADYYSVPVQLPVLLSPDAPFQSLDMAVSVSEVDEERCEASLLVSGELTNSCPDPIVVEAWHLDQPGGEALPEEAVRLDTVEVPGSLGAGSMWMSVDGLPRPMPTDLSMALTLQGSCAPGGVLDAVVQVSCEQGEREHAVVTVTPI